jgi:4-amino-4-deoxy-L-arabinose transferase-like glycosyltransferase
VAHLLIAKSPEITELPGVARPADSAQDVAAVGGLHPLVWILLAGVVVRVVLWFAWSGWSPLLNADAEDYQGLAIRLATTGAYSSASGELISLRPPLYAAIVAATYRVAGLQNDDAVRAIQACASLLTALFAYRMGLLVYSRRVALWAAAITCFYPALLAYPNVLLSETWFTFFAIGFAWLLLEGVHRERIGLLLAAGIFLGLAALTRSIMLLFVPPMAMYLLWAFPGTWRRRTLAAVAPVCVFTLVIAPWAVRNTRLQETFTLIDVMGGRNAMMGNYEFTPTERSWATITDVTGERAWHQVLAREASGKSLGNQGQLDKRALSHAIHYVVTNPAVTLKRDVVKFFNFWQLERTFVAAARDDYFGNSRASLVAVVLLTTGTSAAVLLAAIFGVCCVPPASWRDHVFLIGSILFPCVIHSLIFAHERYRLPVMPLLSLYAAAALVDWRQIWDRRWSAGFRAAVVLSIILVLGWLREIAVVDLRIAERFFE